MMPMWTVQWLALTKEKDAIEYNMKSENYQKYNHRKMSKVTVCIFFSNHLLLCIRSIVNLWWTELVMPIWVGLVAGTN